MTGETIATITGPAEAGLNRVLWNMRRSAAGGGRGGGVLLPPGDYLVTVAAGGTQQKKVGRIRERIR
jgi:hypothetical protein